MNFSTLLASNFTTIIALFGIIITAGTFVFSIVQWRDSRKRELDNQRYLQYREIIRVISGSTKQEIHPPEQIVCVRLLLEFEGYYETTLKVFSNPTMLKLFNDNW